MQEFKDILLQAGVKPEYFDIKATRRNDPNPEKTAQLYVSNIKATEKDEFYESIHFGLRDFYYRIMIFHPDTQKVYLELVSHFVCDRETHNVSRTSYISTTVQDQNISEKDARCQFYEFITIAESKTTDNPIELTKLEPGQRDEILAFLCINGMLLSKTCLTEKS